jgi:hypothetical protein
VIAMLRKLFPSQFRIAGRAHLCYKIVLVAVLLTAAVAVGWRDGSKDWTVLENCRLIINPANDGDSFHVSGCRNLSDNQKENNNMIEPVTTALQVNATSGNGETAEHKLQVHGCFSSQSFWKAGSARNGSRSHKAITC